MFKINFTTKLSLLISGLYSLLFAFFCLYKVIILYLIKLAMEDTFVGGDTSDISIFLWFILCAILLLSSFLFFYLIKIRDYKSQKILLKGVLIFWILALIFQINLFNNYFYLSFISFIPIFTCYFTGIYN